MSARDVFKIILSFCLLAFLTDCNKGGAAVFPMIKTAGIYNLKPTGFRVSVDIRNQLVVITITDSNGVKMASNCEASNLQRWFLYWDEPTQLLWLESSDIGLITWDVSKGGKPIERAVTQDTKDLIASIPKQITAELSRSHKRALGISK